MQTIRKYFLSLQTRFVSKNFTIFPNFWQTLRVQPTATTSKTCDSIKTYLLFQQFCLLSLLFLSFLFSLSRKRESEREREQLFHYSLLNFANKNNLIIIKRWLLMQSCISLQSCIRLAVNSFLTWIKFGFNFLKLLN